MASSQLSEADRLEILNLYARYRHTVDAHDGEGWADCFTEDGEFEPGLGSHRGRVLRGRAELAALAVEPEREPGVLHFAASPMLWEQDGRVLGTCYGMLVDTSGPAARIVGVSVYSDELARTASGWRFRRRASTGRTDRLEDGASGGGVEH